MWSEKCDSNLFFAEIVWSDLFSWSCLIISSSVLFWSLSLTFDEWRMLILDYRMTYICSRFVERRLWWDVTDEISHQTWRERLIKLDESDSSNSMNENVILSNDENDLSNLMNENVISSNDESDSSNLTKATSSHQVEWARHLIKFFEQTDSFFTFWWAIFCSDTWCEKLSLAESRFLSQDKYLCKTAMISERSWWKLNADITQLLFKRRASSYVKTVDNCWRSDSSSS
jgi:hypothetical protein